MTDIPVTIKDEDMTDDHNILSKLTQAIGSYIFDKLGADDTNVVLMISHKGEGCLAADLEGIEQLFKVLGQVVDAEELDEFLIDKSTMH